MQESWEESFRLPVRWGCYSRHCAWHCLLEDRILSPPRAYLFPIIFNVSGDVLLFRWTLATELLGVIERFYPREELANSPLLPLVVFIISPDFHNPTHIAFFRPRLRVRNGRAFFGPPCLLLCTHRAADSSTQVRLWAVTTLAPVLPTHAPPARLRLTLVTHPQSSLVPFLFLLFPFFRFSIPDLLFHHLWRTPNIADKQSISC